jgi:hypothetical protein
MFWIGIGDIHDQFERLDEIPEIEDARGVIVSGDLTVHGGIGKATRVLEAIKSKNYNIMAQIGNMDEAEVDEFLSAQGMNLHARVRPLDPAVADVGLIGVGYSTPTPFGTPSEVPDEQIEKWLAGAMEQAAGFKRLLLVAHDPPRDTAADRTGGGEHVGSRAVREFIEKHQPEICLTGHIHESRAVDSIGDTVVINPGPLSSGGFVVIEEKDGRLRAELRTL